MYICVCVCQIAFLTILKNNKIEYPKVKNCEVLCQILWFPSDHKATQQILILIVIGLKKINILFGDYAKFWKKWEL